MRAEEATLARLARCSGFCRRLRKLSPGGFVQSCVLQVLQANVSLRLHAALLGLLQGSTVSKQALQQRLKASIGFLQACLAHWIARPIAKELGPLRAGPFARVLVHDSSCIALDSAHAAAFPGPSNQSARPQAALRVQVLYDLLVRDLGYFSLAALAQCAASGASFLSRWRFGAQLRDPTSGQPIALHTLLQPGASLERTVLLSNGLQVRLLALPLDPAVAASRRRLARANRDRRLQHSDAYYYLLGWTLLLTNASAARLPLRLAGCVYRLRWRIEIIFKSWKSYLGLLHASHCGRAQLLPLVLALLLFSLFLHALLPPAPPSFSLLKLASLFAELLLPVCLASLPPAEISARFAAQLRYHGRYESRPRLDYLKLKLFTLS